MPKVIYLPQLRLTSQLQLNSHWLFVATLGCWSVDIDPLRAIAISLVAIFLNSKIFENNKKGKTFKGILEGIEKEISESGLKGDAKKARFHEITEINRGLAEEPPKVTNLN